MLGVVGAGAAWLFDSMLSGSQHLFLDQLANYPAANLESGHLPRPSWWIVVATTLGGLITGFLVFTFAPEAEGHGTDTAVKALHRDDGNIRPRVPFLKAIASAITIGSGGSAGREGPIALIAAGIGSIYARLTGRPATERRLLLLAGMSAGLSAIFRSPIGTALFAVEVLYSRMELEAWALAYCLLSSVVAYAVTLSFSDSGPIFQVRDLPTPEAAQYPYYLLLGLIAGVVGVILPYVFYKVRDFFRALPVPAQIKPAIGGFGVGVISLYYPQILGGGYGTIRQAIAGNLALSLLLILILVKIIALSLTVSSGGSGGVFAPGLFVGAMLGGAIAHLTGQPPEPFVIVGMGAVFSGAARVPISSILMIAEMTSSYQLLAPATFAILASFMVQTALSSRSPYPTLYEAQVPGRSDSPAHTVESLIEAMESISHTADPAKIRIDLFKLLKTHVPIKFEKYQFHLRALGPQDEWNGTTIASVEASGETQIVAVLREESSLFPSPELLLSQGDLLLLSTETAEA